MTTTAPRPPPLTASPYPFAAAPDIIRAHQKDAYFQGALAQQLGDVHRRVCGARSAHAWAGETRTAADALYLALTTLLGNRTLGEEYCDLVQVEAPASSSPQHHGKADDDDDGTEGVGQGGPRLPSLARRAGYIVCSVLLPYLAGRMLPGVRGAMRRRLQARLAVLAARQRDRDLHGRKLSAKPKASPSLEYRVERYLLTHLTSLTSGAHLRAATLAVFYFTGAYYSISKRLFGLRYVFTRRLDDGHSNPSGAGGRAGYEVLGVLLAVQMVVRGYLHVREQLLAAAPAPLSSHPHQQQEAEDYDDQQDFRERAALPFDANVSLDEHAYSANNELLVDPGGGGGRGNQRSLAAIGTTTHTPVPRGERARYDLSRADAVMGWIKGRQQRKCTLCLDEMKDPAATGCGHVFCWACIGDWVREKPECPLCRREAMVQHILPLRAA